MTLARLGFDLRVVNAEADLADAAALRADAYGRHLPGLGAALAQPDAADRVPGTRVLLCRDKASGRAIGTARIQRNHPHPLPIEGSVALPPAMAALPRAEITRLAIAPGADPQVRPLIVKACYLAAVASQIRLLVIGARSAALVRMYRHLGFADLEPGAAPVPLTHAGGLPHHVLVFDVVGAERRWHGSRHALYGFMVETWHPDLHLLDEGREDTEAAHPAALICAS